MSRAVRVFQTLSLTISLFTSVFFFSGSAEASPEETLKYVGSIIQGRRDYNRYWSEYFSSSHPVEKKQEAFFELTGQKVDQESDFLGMAQQIETYVEAYDESLRIIRGEHLRDSILEGPVQTFEKLFFNHPKSIADVEKEQTERIIHRLYFDIWIQFHQEAHLRKVERKHFKKNSSYFAEIESGYSEYPIYKQILRLLSKEAAPWWPKFMRGHEYTVIPGTLMYDIKPHGDQAMNTEIARLSDWVYPATEAVFSKLKIDQATPDVIDAIKALELNFEKRAESKAIWARYVDWHHEAVAKLEKINAQSEKLKQANNPKIIEKFEKSRSAYRTFLAVDVPTRIYPVAQDMLEFLQTAKANLEIISRLQKRNKAALPKEKSAPVNGVSPRSSHSQNEGKLKNGDEKGSEYKDEDHHGLNPPAEFKSKSSRAKKEDLEDEEEMRIFNQGYILAALSRENSPSALSKKISEGSLSAASFGTKVSDPWITELQKKFSHLSLQKDFELFFDDTRNHLQMSIEDVKRLVEAVGGVIRQQGTSHCRIILPHSVGFSWIPHGKAHASKLSTDCIRKFRSAFETSGLVPEALIPQKN